MPLGEYLYPQEYNYENNSSVLFCFVFLSKKLFPIMLHFLESTLFDWLV